MYERKADAHIPEPPKRIDGMPYSYDRKIFEAKLAYLTELRQVELKGIDARNDIESRIKRVCDSIEKDLSV